MVKKGPSLFFSNKKKYFINHECQRMKGEFNPLLFSDLRERMEGGWRRGGKRLRRKKKGDGDEEEPSLFLLLGVEEKASWEILEKKLRGSLNNGGGCYIEESMKKIFGDCTDFFWIGSSNFSFLFPFGASPCPSRLLESYARGKRERGSIDQTW